MRNGIRIRHKSIHKYFLGKRFKTKEKTKKFQPSFDLDH